MSIGSVFYNTKVIVVDDEKDYLYSIKNALALDFDLEVEDKLADALSMINEPFDDIDFSSEIHGSIDEVIKNIESNQDKFQEFGVLVVDYNMKGMNGIEFCEQITNPYIIKIMLSGMKDKEVVIDAFNEKKIDAFISKLDTDCTDNLINKIKIAQKDYCKNRTSKINAFNIEALETMNACQELPALIDDFCEENDINEYYFVSRAKGFSAYSDDRKYHILLMNEEDYNLQIEYATSQKSHGDHVFSLRNREVVCNFQYTDDGYYPLDSVVKEGSFIKAKCLSQEAGYYYGIAAS